MILTPGEATLAQLEAIYRGDAVRLDPRCDAAVQASARVIAEAAAGDTAVYGVNTGFGKLASTRIGSADDYSALQGIARILTRQPGDTPLFEPIQHKGIIPKGGIPYLGQRLGGMAQQQLVAQGHHLIGVGDEHILPVGGAASQQGTGQHQAGQSKVWEDHRLSSGPSGWPPTRCM